MDIQTKIDNYISETLPVKKWSKEMQLKFQEYKDVKKTYDNFKKVSNAFDKFGKKPAPVGFQKDIGELKSMIKKLDSSLWKSMQDLQSEMPMF